MKGTLIFTKHRTIENKGYVVILPVLSYKIEF